MLIFAGTAIHVVLILKIQTKMASQQFKTQYDFLFIGRDEGSFVENYAYDLGEGGESSGKIYICLEILQNSIDPEKIGEIIFDKMRKIFFVDSEVDSYERFEESVKEVNRSLNEYKSERGNDWLGKLNVIITAIVGNQLYLTQSGEAEAYLVRKKLATTISDDLSDVESKDIFTNIASGDLESGDLVLLSTTRLLRYVSKNDLSKHITGNLQNTVQSIKDFLHGEVISKIGLIAVQASQVKADLVSGEKIAHLREESFQDVDAVEQTSIDSRLKSAGASLDKMKVLFNKSLSGVKNRISDWKSEGSVRRGSSESGSGWDFSNWGKDKILMAIVALIFVLTLGVLLQDFITYNFSVKESVAVGRSDKNIDMDTVEKATKQSTSNSFVDKLEKKYDHMIGVEFGGIEPSKGQRQKLAKQTSENQEESLRTSIQSCAR
jgi:hypothetical protein